MGVFNYNAVDANAVSDQGTILADSPRQARDQLRARGLKVRSLVEQRESRDSWALLTRKRVSQSKVAMTIQELSTLLAVGVPLSEALTTVAKQHTGAMLASLLALRDKVGAGMSLADAMSEQPGVFDELTVRMTEVGENSGTLENVLQQLADFKERSLQLKDQVTGALTYPAIVFATSVAVTVFLMTVVVPMLLANLIESGRPLPWPTQVLQFLSDTILGYWFPVLVVLAVIIVGVLVAIRTSKGRRIWHRLLLKIPIFGSMIRKQAVSRLAMVMAALMRSGMVYLRALEIGARTTPNAIIQSALQESGELVKAGRDIGEALETTGVFPPVVVQVFSVGQETGRLEEMLERLAKDYDRQVSSLSTRLASILEPALILVLAVFIGFILFATLLPILEAGNAI